MNKSVCLMLVLVAGCTGGVALAENLPDPTRPPPDIMGPPQVEAGSYRPPGLQSIIISGQRRAAIIDGETVELGGKYGNARLIAIHEGYVVLRGAGGTRQVLSLFPDVKISGKKATGTLQSPAADVHRKPGAKPPASRENQ